MAEEITRRKICKSDQMETLPHGVHLHISAVVTAAINLLCQKTCQVHAMEQHSIWELDETFCSGEYSCSYIASGIEYTRAARKADSEMIDQSCCDDFVESFIEDDMM